MDGGFPPETTSVSEKPMEPGGAKTYKIGQAAKLLDVKPFVLRFWEGEFREVLVPVRTPSGQRAYTEGNLDMVRRIKRLLYDEGLTIEGAKKRLLADPTGKATAAPAAAPAPAMAMAPTMERQPAQAPLLVSAPAQQAIQTSQIPQGQPDMSGVSVRDTTLLREVEGELSALLALLSRA